MPDLVTGPGFDALFTSFAHSAWRLETRDRYDVPAERAPLRRFLDGLADDVDYRVQRQPFLNGVRDSAQAGKRRQRVRVVPEPLTSYLRFELALTRDNAAAGEDIRYLQRDRANELGLPDHDFWLFDGERLALMYFTADDRLLGAELVTDREMVARHRIWMSRALDAATPYPDYLAEAPARALPPRGSG